MSNWIDSLTPLQVAGYGTLIGIGLGVLVLTVFIVYMRATE